MARMQLPEEPESPEEPAPGNQVRISTAMQLRPASSLKHTAATASQRVTTKIDRGHRLEDDEALHILSSDLPEIRASLASPAFADVLQRHLKMFHSHTGSHNEEQIADSAGNPAINNNTATGISCENDSNASPRTSTNNNNNDNNNNDKNGQPNDPRSENEHQQFQNDGDGLWTGSTAHNLTNYGGTIQTPVADRPLGSDLDVLATAAMIPPPQSPDPPSSVVPHFASVFMAAPPASTSQRPIQDHRTEMSFLMQKPSSPEPVMAAETHTDRLTDSQGIRAGTVGNGTNLPNTRTTSMNFYEHSTNDAAFPIDFLDFLSSNASMLDFMELPGPDNSQVSITDRASSIPSERFAEVARLWPDEMGASAANKFATNLWAEVVAYKGDNICADTSVSEPSPASSVGANNVSKWGMDEGKREELIEEFAIRFREYPTSEAYEPSPVDFPPARLLNLGLDIAFRQPHSLLPFIHQPTFSVKSAPNSIVFPLCLLGLVLLDSKRVRDFTHAYIPVAVDKCSAQLSQSFSDPGGVPKLITGLTSATLLLLAWPIRRAQNGQYPHDELRAQALYNQTISTAKLSGLFNPRTEMLISKDLLSSVLARSQTSSSGHLQNDDQLWKAWARVESVKRLVMTLLMIDAWWAYNLGTPPLIRTHNLWLEMACSGDLYQCPSAKHWKRLVSGGAAIVMAPVLMQMNPPSMRLSAAQDHSPVSMVGLLSIVWIRILEVRSRMLPRLSGHSERALVPCLVYATDETGGMLGHMLNEIYSKSFRYLKYKNPNCVTMWHFLHLQLLANNDIFELAAGRDGAESARAALRDIAIWSQTFQARRACLHAAGIYMAMSRRRINDGTMFHSEPALFQAALVLGLYVFMMNNPAGEYNDEMHLDSSRNSDMDSEPYELLDDVDWLDLGLDGLAPTDVGIAVQGDSLAKRFLKEGGVITFSGSICEGGYNAAKMILLEFANLLEEVGKWNAKGFCHILRIMSDSLLEIDES
ncbi:hypothetical protein CNMCM5793_004071 [Aspergillus hiratsukae]|uniref:Xylanolytic transcriptional activator regulatory domain-containing protein n=1 Tax=Aspergillus hiratsukae TaxID=1194566 RepID=A0A8H6PEM6_9EURO|nr:hypothetical protein CNMCM5793_004071 [Aspergillus hiratsukae]